MNNPLLQNEENISLPADSKKAVLQTMKAIEQLQTVYERETEILERSDSKSFFAMQDEKLQAARTYQSYVNQLLARRDEIRSNVDEATRKSFAVMQENFSHLATRNLAAIERMQRCLGRLGDTITRAARQEAQKRTNTRYGASGQLHQRKTGTISMGLSETA